MDIENTTFGIPSQSGIGDALQYSRHPEFYHREFGKKMRLSYVDKFGLFANNPYVILDTQMIPEINLWGLALPMRMGSPVYQNLSKLFDVSEFDDDIKPTIYGKTSRGESPAIAINTEGARTHRENGHCRELPQPVAEMIVDKLHHKFSFIQIGGKSDYRLHGSLDLRGWRLDKTHELLSSCDLFVGPNSGMMHLAACAEVPMFIYTNVGVNDPPWSNKKYPTHDWFYRSTRYIGPRGKQNVIPLMEFIDGVDNDD